VAWVAALINHDIVSQGTTPVEAAERLLRAAEATVVWSIHDGHDPWAGIDQNNLDPASLFAMAGWRERHAHAVELSAAGDVSKLIAYKFNVVVDAGRFLPSKKVERIL
jgi:hypothetical protein